LKRIFLLIIGHISVSLGVAGIFLPILPTTPFLLLSAACYIRSSEKFYDWLINHKVLGLYVKNYILFHAITLKAKLFSIFLLWLILGSTIIFIIDSLFVRIILTMIGLGVTTHLITIKTLTNEMVNQSNDSKEIKNN